MLPIFAQERLGADRLYISYSSRGVMLPNHPEDHVHAHRFGIIESSKAGGSAAHFAQQVLIQIDFHFCPRRVRLLLCGKCCPFLPNNFLMQIDFALYDKTGEMLPPFPQELPDANRHLRPDIKGETPPIFPEKTPHVHRFVHRFGSRQGDVLPFACFQKGGHGAHVSPRRRPGILGQKKTFFVPDTGSKPFLVREIQKFGRADFFHLKKPFLLF